MDTFCGEGAYLLTTLIEQMIFSRSHFPGEDTRAQRSMAGLRPPFWDPELREWS